MPHEPAARQGGAPDFSRIGFSSTDLSVITGIPFLAALAWLVSEKNWPVLCRRLAPLAIGDLSPDPKAAADLIRRTLGPHLPDMSGDDILHGMAAEGILTFMQVLRSYPRGNWTPKVRLLDPDRIIEARKKGKGVVLWVGHAFHGHLAAKVAFHGAGLRVTHLSHPTHGFSSSRFGIRYLNRLQRAVEDPFIGERVLLPLEGQNRALHVLARRLKENGVVSITGQRGTGRSVEAPFLDGSIHLAPGAPSLAQMTGAAILPVFAFRKEDGIVDVTVEPEITLATSQSRDATVAHAVGEYARLLERQVLRYPAQWLGWVQL